MATFRARKVVSALPTPLEPDTLYAVRVGEGFDLYISDNTGTLAHKVNGGGGGGSSAWVEIASILPIGYSFVTFNNLKATAYNNLMVVFEGVSQGASGSYPLTLAVSPDGATWSNAIAVGAGIGPSVSWWGKRYIPDFRSDFGVTSGGCVHMPSTGQHEALLNPASAWRVGAGGLDAIRIACAVGMDAGTIRLMGN